MSEYWKPKPKPQRANSSSSTTSTASEASNDDDDESQVSLYQEGDEAFILDEELRKALVETCSPKSPAVKALAALASMPSVEKVSSKPGCIEISDSPVKAAPARKSPVFHGATELAERRKRVEALQCLGHGTMLSAFCET